jgi:CheY-like chemotaxis protein
MPGLDGYEVVRILRRERATARTPIVLLSGAPNERPKLGGADAAVMKPCTPADLLGVIRRLVGRA